MTRMAWFGALIAGALLVNLGTPFARAGETMVLRSGEGIEAVFEQREGRYLWVGYRDTVGDRAWTVEGPRFSVETVEAPRADLSAGFSSLKEEPGRIVLETDLAAPRVTVRQSFSFCDDARTLRVASSLRATGSPVLIRRVGLLEVRLAEETLRLMGPELVSSPVFGERVFAGVEHPSAWCQVNGDSLFLVQHPYVEVGAEWVDLPGAIFGCASEGDVVIAEKEAVRRAFLRYLDTVRVKPKDMHVHYNDWWTAPVPSSEEFVLGNIAALKAGLYDQTGVFFDSYALDAGWSDVHSVWQIDKAHFPEGFKRIEHALAEMGARPGLWVSPSSLYPFTLDNAWLESAGYEVTPHPGLKRNACLAKGGKYQRAFKEAVLQHTAAAHLAHVKFDGYVPECSVAEHGHKLGPESRLAVAEGLMEVFDALRAKDPDIALEPTCFGYQPSPWWLMHTPFIIGPFGDDCPQGRCPCPEWIEALTTARDIKNLEGRDSFLMPSSALQCFDIIVQCPGAFQNHAAMAIGRGRWFLSCYINPKHMDQEEWRFFGELITWAREHREFLQEPLPIGGNPAERQAYGYAFLGTERQLYCLRNPWIEETALALPQRASSAGGTREVRSLYPRRAVLARAAGDAPLPDIPLGPYETLFVEVVPTKEAPLAMASGKFPDVMWRDDQPAAVERIVYEGDAAFGPSWSTLEGNISELHRFSVAGTLELRGIRSAELCVLCEGDPEVSSAPHLIRMDGIELSPAISASYGAFSASSAKDVEGWTWFTRPLSEGVHLLEVSISSASASARFGVFVRGTTDALPSPPPFETGAAFPLYAPELRSWSRILVPQTKASGEDLPLRRVPRTVQHIDGIYLDALDWRHAGAGWGSPRRNQSVMEKRMTLGGRAFLRGLGTHADSVLEYTLPEGYRSFSATIGKDQEVSGGSVVFVVEGDGRELFRSPVMRNDTPPAEITVPIAGIQTLTLRVENAGDGIAADHADWADAQLLR